MLGRVERQLVKVVLKKGHKSSRTGKNITLYKYYCVWSCLSGYLRKGMVLKDDQENAHCGVIQLLRIHSSPPSPAG